MITDYQADCYNDAEATLNKAVTTIPWMFLAPLAGASEREYDQIPGNAQ